MHELACEQLPAGSKLAGECLLPATVGVGSMLYVLHDHHAF